MVNRSELESCLEYANRLEDLQIQKSDHQSEIVDSSYTQNVYEQRIQICNYVIWGLLGILGIFVLVIASSFDASSVTDPDEYAVFMLPVFLLISLFITVYIKKNFKHELKYAQDNEKKIIANNSAAIEEIDCQIIELVQEMVEKNVFEVIPTAYFYSSAIEYIISVFDRRLADSMKEAFKLLEAEIQRSEDMERQNELNESLLHEIQQLKHAVDINTYITYQTQNKG